jgi:hypothetical protein
MPVSAGIGVLGARRFWADQAENERGGRGGAAVRMVLHREAPAPPTART